MIKALAIITLLSIVPNSSILHDTSNLPERLCMPPKVLLNLLRERFEEELTVEGTSSNGVIVETYVALDGSWTMIVSYPGEASCVLGSGDNWTTYRKDR
jgi:hypothetical protein